MDRRRQRELELRQRREAERLQRKRQFEMRQKQLKMRREQERKLKRLAAQNAPKKPNMIIAFMRAVFVGKKRKTRKDAFMEENAQRIANRNNRRFLGGRLVKSPYDEKHAVAKPETARTALTPGSPPKKTAEQIEAENRFYNG